MIVSILWCCSNPKKREVFFTGEIDGTKFWLPLINLNSKGLETGFVESHALLEVGYEYSQVVKHLKASKSVHFSFSLFAPNGFLALGGKSTQGMADCRANSEKPLVLSMFCQTGVFLAP